MTEFALRQEKFRQSITSLKRLMLDAQISEFAIFKDYTKYRWIGNDIDVIVHSADIGKLEHILRNGNDATRWKHSSVHSRGIEIKSDGLFDMDVHTSIGWRGIELFDFVQLSKYVETKEKFGVEYPALSNAVDALIYSHSAVFDKGFVSLLESKILEDNMSEFDSLELDKSLVDSYIDFAKDMDRNTNYPIFLPLSMIIRGFRKRIASGRNPHTMTGRVVRMIAIQLFWRIRYALTGKLPFRIPQYGQ